ncbi:MAG: hypothetical protein C0478_00355 [Planctomyces sp.]|nr:hypothetical protein [Planctomyces sp.]
MNLFGFPIDWGLALQIGIPAVMVLIGSISLINSIVQRMHHQTAEGEVVRQVTHRDSDGDLLTKSIVRFETDEGWHEVEDQMAFRPPAHKIGQLVTMMYPPGEPQKAAIRRDWALVIFTGLTVIGTVVLVFVIQSAIKEAAPVKPLPALVPQNEREGNGDEVNENERPPAQP